jgi:hypothetical protein
MVEMIDYSAFIFDCETKLVVNFFHVFVHGQEIELVAKSDLKGVRDWHLKLLLHTHVI